jgi:hypothetical protein
MFPLFWSTVSEPARAAQFSACSRSRSKAAIPLPATTRHVGRSARAMQLSEADMDVGEPSHNNSRGNRAGGVAPKDGR